MSTKDLYQDEDMMHQDHERGPGWFLKISYIVIAIFCIYYFFTYKDWKSNYEQQQDQIQERLKK